MLCKNKRVIIFFKDENKFDISLFDWHTNDTK